MRWLGSAEAVESKVDGDEAKSDAEDDADIDRARSRSRSRSRTASVFTVRGHERIACCYDLRRALTRAVCINRSRQMPRKASTRPWRASSNLTCRSGRG